MPINGVGTCDECVWWSNNLPHLATGSRRSEGADPQLGTCHAMPPTVRHVGIPPVPASVFPEVHASRFCGHWNAIVPDDDDDPDGDGGEEADVVVPFQRAA